jgi:hypothetical protein
LRLEPTRLGATVPLHGDSVTSYFLAVHELTHPITDPLAAEVLGFDPARRSLDPANPAFAGHQLLKNTVMIANYWMFALAADVVDLLSSSSLPPGPSPAAQPSSPTPVAASASSSPGLWSTWGLGQ